MEWKAVDWIDGYKGVLEISNTGAVRRHSYKYETGGRWGTTHTTTKPDKVLTPYTDRRGYVEIAVQVAGVRRKFSVHHLVARGFCPGYASSLVVNHINGVKNDNRAENLEWVTRARNTQLAWEDGLVNVRGNFHPSRKLHSGQVRIIRRLLSIGATSNELAVLLNLSASTIRLIKDGERWASVT